MLVYSNIILDDTLTFLFLMSFIWNFPTYSRIFEVIIYMDKYIAIYAKYYLLIPGKLRIYPRVNVNLLTWRKLLQICANGL